MNNSEKSARRVRFNRLCFSQRMGRDFGCRIRNSYGCPRRPAEPSSLRNAAKTCPRKRGACHPAKSRDLVRAVERKYTVNIGRWPRLMKPIVFSRHALDQAHERGATEDEVRQAISEGESVPARGARGGYRLNFPFGRSWGGQVYAIKQVMPIVAEEADRIVVVTVYVFYF